YNNSGRVSATGQLESDPVGVSVSFLLPDLLPCLRPIPMHKIPCRDSFLALGLDFEQLNTPVPAACEELAASHEELCRWNLLRCKLHGHDFQAAPTKSSERSRPRLKPAKAVVDLRRAAAEINSAVFLLEYRS